MCGIVGYLGTKSLLNILVQGLHRLEYRGYDSAGVAWVDELYGLHIHRAKGEVANLEARLQGIPCEARVGIAHTRWATHGEPSERNAHPHRDFSGKIAVVHNGIVENYAAIRSTLEGHGIVFQSDTDTETIAQLIGHYYAEGHSFEESVRLTISQVEGAFGLAIVCSDFPEKLIAARRGSPLLIGIGKDEFVLASDPSAVLEYTTHVIYLADNEIAVIANGEVLTSTLDQKRVHKKVETLELEIQDIELGAFPHYMLKEIYEQPVTLRNTLSGRINSSTGREHLAGIEELGREFSKVRQIMMLGCGTAWHAGMVGSFMVEELARIPSVSRYASEFRYGNPIVEEGTLAVILSQSGETADTLAALEEVQLRGATAFGLVNTVGSSIARKADAGAYLRVGPEIGVASTKAFTAQVALLAILAIALGRRKNLSMNRCIELFQQLQEIPNKIQQVLDSAPQIRQLTAQFVARDNWLYLGRGVSFPVALEGALKLKEISYIHAEGMPAAEMKHGPIALIDKGMPVVVVAPKDHLHTKLISNIQEVLGRGGEVIAICTQGDDRIKSLTRHVIEIPETDPLLSPLLSVIPLQLIAYEAALLRGHNVDKPRNLAKSVTVE